MLENKITQKKEENRTEWSDLPKSARYAISGYLIAVGLGLVYCAYSYIKDSGEFKKDLRKWEQAPQGIWTH